MKRYSSEKAADEEGGWRQTRIVLSPINRDYQPIALTDEAAGSVEVIAEFIGVLGRA